MSQRPLRTALSVGALAAIACSVYGPEDLNGTGGSGGIASGGSTSGSGGTLSGGSGGGGSGNGGGQELGGAGSTSSGGSSGTGASAGVGGDAAGGQGEGGEGDAGSAGAAGNGGSTPMGGTTSGGGGGSSGGPVAGGGTSSGTGGSSGGGPTYPVELIENMEDGNLFILANEMRDGNWYSAYDKSSSASDPAMVSVTDSPSKGSTRAFHFKGNGSSGWGALSAFDFVFVGTAKKAPYDGAHYKGITFYAKAAAATTVTVRVPIVATTANAVGSTCTPAPATMPNCEDHYFVDVPFTTSWRAVTVLWTDLHQTGWGKQTWNAAQLLSVQFLVTSAAEFWVDDISFAK